MQQNFKNTSARQTNFTFVNPGFSDFPEILKLQNDGIKIKIVFEKDLPRFDFFQPTSLFPLQINEFPQKLSERKCFQKLYNLAPHLILPHKIFYPGKSFFQKYSALFADFLYQNKYQQKRQLLFPSHKDIFTFLNKSSQQGLFFQEYQINVSRLFIEILKYIKIGGGEIQTQTSFPISSSDEGSETIKNCKPESTLVYRISTETFAGFSMQVQNQNSRVCFYEQNNNLEIQVLTDKNKLTVENEILFLHEKYFRIKQSGLTVADFPQKLQPKILKDIVSQIKSPLPGTFQDAKPENIFELCREKFDVAKQTGIDFPEFKILFHRYGKNIDEMTEKAYEFMNETRDPIKIWALTEDWIRKEKEWKN